MRSFTDSDRRFAQSASVVDSGEKKMWARAVLVLVLLWGAYGAWAARDGGHRSGMLAPELPQQVELSEALENIHRAGFMLTPVARFELSARVLGREIYRFDSVAALSPVDLALGWGPMSDSQVLEGIKTSQSSRFLYWYSEKPSIAREVIEQHATNAHIIPATAEIEQRLQAIQVGQIVRIAGLLVNAYRPEDGYRWNTSLRRDDTGDGACEIVYVTELQMH